MNETYLPTPALLSLGQRRRDAEQDNTLLRFPGPCGFAELAQRRLTHLAPYTNPYVYLFENRFSPAHQGIERFGVLAIFKPARLGVVHVKDQQVLAALGFEGRHESVFLGLNAPLPNVTSAQSQFVWIPPELYFKETRWSHIGSPDAVEDLFQRSYGRSLESRVIELEDGVLAYMEEVALVVKEGLNLDRPWFCLSDQERQHYLSELKCKGRWTPRS